MPNKRFKIIGICLAIFSTGLIAGSTYAFVNEPSFFTGLFKGQKISYCRVKNFNPDPNCTPGNADVIDESKICIETAKRGITNGLKRQVFKNYGLDWPQPYGAYEFDHRIAKWAGGSDYPSNLWPQPSPEFQLKDRLEFLLYKRYCKKIITLEQVRNEMIDWHNSYKKYFEDKSIGSFNYEMMDYNQNPEGNQ